MWLHPDQWYATCDFFPFKIFSVIANTRIKMSLFLQGPTEAERKIEELTRQLEEEMEKQEEEGEYFG